MNKSQGTKPAALTHSTWTIFSSPSTISFFRDTIVAKQSCRRSKKGTGIYPISTCSLWDFREAVGDNRLFCLLLTYSMTGCGWVMEMVWLILQGGDISKAKVSDVKSKYSRLEHDDLSFSRTTGLKPRIVISHLPFDLLQNILGRCKRVIFVQRDPRDCLLSMFHYYKQNPKLGQFKGSWSDYFDLYKERKLIYGNYCDWIKPWMETKIDKMQIFEFERLVRNRFGHIRNMTKFILDKHIDDKMMDICQWIHIDNMKGTSKKPDFSLDPILLDPEITDFLREGHYNQWEGLMNKHEMDFIVFHA
ncbi:hypothetical protein CAPTEDRAFT_145508 [Capitella teleta]|uniref:Sulfotransferase domain-containing protein n=1 Tax=Capitella teleta TaxID=283909 RepID=R7UHR8_CAPTE|nr:hypothetical protein CAPTEDRAFT_145508 [Capitella teleta]|eukprot:ELU05623.1 hypothetical protein CAPTEDRAFT_145508 [Capitella teleta]